MAIKYICRHCRTDIGQIDSAHIDESVLGFQFLSPEERNDIVNYQYNGDVMVRVICDYCREALDAHPELALVASPLQ
jgi:hypothetical protein